MRALTPSANAPIVAATSPSRCSAAFPAARGKPTVRAIASRGRKTPPSTSRPRPPPPRVGRARGRSLPGPPPRHHPAEGAVPVEPLRAGEVWDAESVAHDAHGPGKTSHRPGLGHAAGYQIGVEGGTGVQVG